MPFLMENEVGKVKITLRAVRGSPNQKRSQKVGRGPLVRMKDDNAVSVAAPKRKTSEDEYEKNGYHEMVEKTNVNYDDDDDDSEDLGISKPKMKKPTMKGKGSKDIYDDSDKSDSGKGSKRAQLTAVMTEKTAYDDHYDNLGPDLKNDSDKYKKAKGAKPRRYTPYDDLRDLTTKKNTFSKGGGRRVQDKSVNDERREEAGIEPELDKKTVCSKPSKASNVSNIKEGSKNEEFGSSREFTGQTRKAHRRTRVDQ